MTDRLKGLVKQLRGLVRKDRVERELDEELRFHLEMEAAELARGGLTAADARRRAHVAFGGVERYKERVREARWIRLLEDLGADVRYALRALRRNPAYATAAVLTLGLGIGANTAVFSVLDAVLLRPLPYATPERLVVAGTTDRGESVTSGAPFAQYGEYAAWQRESRTLESVGAYTIASHALTGGLEPVLAQTLVIDAALLTTLGVSPLLGRGFTPDLDRAGGAAAVLLSHEQWRTNFGADPGVVGRTVELNGRGFEVRGVLPAGFDFPPATRRADGWWSFKPALFIPLGAISAEMEYYPYFVVGRLAEGATAALARAELAALSTAHAPPAGGGRARDIHVVGLQEAVVGPLRPALLAFVSAVAFVLLIACVNLSALMLARLSARGRELGVRLALGAGPRRIARQLVTETAVLAMLGGLAGIAIGGIGLRVLVGVAPDDVPGLANATLNVRVLAFTLAVTAGAGVLCTLLPALTAGGRAIAPLSGGARGGIAERRLRRTHGALVGAEVALAAALLVAAGLLIRSFGVLAGVDPGFRTDHVLTVDVVASSQERAAVLSYYAELERRIGALPGVVAASAVDRLPFGTSSSRVAVRTGFGLPASGEAAPAALNLTARPGYFEALDILLVRGRGFDDRDLSPDAQPTVVVSRSLADRLWPDRDDAVGQHVTVFGTTAEVVGIAGEVRHFGPAVEPEPMIYFAHATDPVVRRGMTLVVRTRSAPESIAPLVRAEIRGVDPFVPISDVRTFTALHAGKVAGERFNALLVSFFSGLALLLVAVGISGVMAFAIAQRTCEIGVRMALGATGAGVRTWVLRDAGALVIAGLAIGLLAALPLTRLLRGLLFGVEPLDPVSFVMAAAVLLAVGFGAAWLPARRASRIEPLAALRNE